MQLLQEASANTGILQMPVFETPALGVPLHAADQGRRALWMEHNDGSRVC